MYKTGIIVAVLLSAVIARTTVAFGIKNYNPEPINIGELIGTVLLLSLMVIVPTLATYWILARIMETIIRRRGVELSQGKTRAIKWLIMGASAALYIYLLVRGILDLLAST